METNGVLAILVRAWANRLEREIDLLREQLPESMAREKAPVYSGPEMLGVATQANNPEHWHDEPGDYVALNGLSALLTELRQAENELQAE